MKLYNGIIGSVVHGVLIGIIGSATTTFAEGDKVLIDLKNGEIAIVIPEGGAYDGIEVYANKSSKIIKCVLCKDDVDTCRKDKNKYCVGSIDVVFQNVLPLSVVDTQDKHSPNTCYRQICWSGGCTTVSYLC